MKNYDLEIQRIKLKIQQIDLSRSTVLLRATELEDEKFRLLSNLPKYDEEEAQAKKDIATLEEQKQKQQES